MSYNPIDDLDVMTLTVWAEARGESAKGQAAVASVIRTRYKNPRWWSRNKGDGIPDDTIAAVCRDPWQFSCWNPNDPNRLKLEDVKTQQRPDFLKIKEICRSVLDGKIPDSTNSADHYCVTEIINYTAWTKRRKPCAVIGKHSFFRLEV